MDFIKLTIDSDSELWVHPNRIEAIKTLNKENIEIEKCKALRHNIPSTFRFTTIYLNSGESFMVKETYDEILAMFPECPF